jgi:hypothetical protein
VKYVDDDKIRSVVRRLARPHPSGGETIERSVILAEGSDSAAIIAWVLSHSGVPDSTTAMAAKRGIHGTREQQRDVEASNRPPLRFVLPAGSLD